MRLYGFFGSTCKGIMDSGAARCYAYRGFKDLKTLHHKLPDDLHARPGKTTVGHKMILGPICSMRYLFLKFNDSCIFAVPKIITTLVHCTSVIKNHLRVFHFGD